MQWSLDGLVNWTAPRLIALAFTPVLATCVLLAAVVATVVLEPRQGQDGLEVPSVLVMGLTFIAVHALHLKMIARTFEQVDR